MEYQAKPLSDREQTKANTALSNLAKAQEELAFEMQFQGPRNQSKIDDLELKIWKLERDAKRWKAGQYGHKIVKQDIRALARAQANIKESSKGMAERMGLPFLREKFLKKLSANGRGIEDLEFEDGVLSIYLQDGTKTDALAWSELDQAQAYRELESANVAG